MIKVITNIDKEYVKEVRKKINENNGHCACAISFNNDNKCMCKEFREQIKNESVGECHCGLYFIVKEGVEV